MRFHMHNILNQINEWCFKLHFLKQLFFQFDIQTKRKKSAFVKFEDDLVVKPSVYLFTVIMIAEIKLLCDCHHNWLKFDVKGRWKKEENLSTVCKQQYYALLLLIVVVVIVILCKK